jgi:hypothetical protein
MRRSPHDSTEMPISCRLALSTWTVCASEHTSSDVSAMFMAMLGVLRLAHKLPGSCQHAGHDFSHLEFRRVTGYVRHVPAKK